MTEWYVVSESVPVPELDPEHVAKAPPNSVRDDNSLRLVATDKVTIPAADLDLEALAAAVPAPFSLAETARFGDTVVLAVSGGTAQQLLAELTGSGLSELGLIHAYGPGDGPFKTAFPVKSGHAGTAREAVAPLPEPADPGGPDRPVVAILDGGIGDHPWFVDDGRTSSPEIVTPGVGSQASTVDGEPGPFAGHGTFVAGLIRQYAPGAEIVSHQVMDRHGTFWEGAVVASLQALVKRVASGERLDVVCLAFGYYCATPGTDPHTRELAQLLGELGEHEVEVVVSAGNDSTDCPSFPAALGRLSDPPTRPRKTPLVAVGALNPDGSPASYSNHGDWVGKKAVGTAVVSTIPKGFATEPASSEPVEFNDKNLASGFATWGGTSFAAAVYAGERAAAIAAGRRGDPR